MLPAEIAPTADWTPAAIDPTSLSVLPGGFRALPAITCCDTDSSEASNRQKRTCDNPGNEQENAANDVTESTQWVRDDIAYDGWRDAAERVPNGGDGSVDEIGHCVAHYYRVGRRGT